MRKKVSAPAERVYFLLQWRLWAGLGCPWEWLGCPAYSLLTVPGQYLRCGAFCLLFLFCSVSLADVSLLAVV